MKTKDHYQHTSTMIIGGGLAGLSCAYHLKSPSIIIERENEVGGTARSVKTKGFTFDFTGHLLHLHQNYTKKLIRSFLKGNIMTCRRNAWIFSHNTYTRYPFQVNTFGLPPSVVKECVDGFKKAARLWKDEKKRKTSLLFDTWSRRNFGDGIHKHFMKPYNEKLWRTPLNRMTAEWCGPFVPQPKIEDVIDGSRKAYLKKFGYNTTFLYPRHGGIQSLSLAMARNLNVQTETSLQQLLWKEKKAVLSTGKVISYQQAVSSLPLIEILKRMPELPSDILKAQKLLRWTSILDINLGIERPHISDKSWIYFPEKDYIFYRVGFPMNFTSSVAPRGCSSMYIEVSHDPTEKLNYDEVLRRVRVDLIRCGILKETDIIRVANFIPIRYAYVIYDNHRKRTLPSIIRFLNQNQIYSIGRYGAWKYSFMEEAILDGKKTAESIDNNIQNQ